MILEQRPWLDAQTLCDSGNVVDRDVALGPLDRTQVGTIDPALVRQGLLADTARSTEPAHVLREDIP